jgi:glycosyltransferase involved in cell wall biosynthesis
MDLIHIHVSVRGSTLRKAYIADIAARRGIPYICQIHSGQYAIFLRTAPLPLRRVAIRMLAKAQRVSVLGNCFAEELSVVTSLPLERFVVIPNAVPDWGITPREGGGLCTFLFLGRMGVTKGVDVLAEALVPCLDLEWHLVAAGDGDDSAFRNLPPDRVSVLGWQSRDSVRKLLVRADVLVLPTRSEAMPMAVLEAMSASRAVVSTRVGAIPEVISSGLDGILVNAESVHELTDALRLVVAQPALRKRLGLAARARWQQAFSLGALEANLETLYDSILDSPEGSRGI